MFFPPLSELTETQFRYTYSVTMGHSSIVFGCIHKLLKQNCSHKNLYAAVSTFSFTPVDTNICC